MVLEVLLVVLIVTLPAREMSSLAHGVGANHNLSVGRLRLRRWRPQRRGLRGRAAVGSERRRRRWALI